MSRPRAKLKDLHLAEFSLVRRPAQEGATVALVKSGEDSGDRVILAKAAPPAASTPTEKKTMADPADEMKTCKGCKKSMPADSKTCPACGAAVTKSTPPQESVMTDQEKAALEARVAKAEKIADLNDVQKAYLRRLPAHEQDAFLALTPAQKADELKPVHTSEDGTVYTKAHDPALVTMAKSADADRKRFRDEMAKSQDLVFKARVDKELAHLPGTAEERAALLKAVDGISDEKLREGALKALLAGDEAASKSFQRQGTGNGGKTEKGSDDPAAQLQKMAEEHAKEHKVDVPTAYLAVIDTAKGAELYGKIPTKIVG